jgi:AcrR family transcriptional regulator
MDRHSPTRRRLEMTGDIIATAREHLRSGGMNAISLRAIAREIGVTPAALYRYFADLNALIYALRNDILDELNTVIEAARDQDAKEGSTARIRSMARAFRGWALDYPAEFRFLLGLGLGPQDKAATACEQTAEQILRIADTFLAEFTRSPQQQLAKAKFLAAWVRLYGLVALESSGDLKWMLSEVETIFDITLTELAAAAGGLQPNATIASLEPYPSTR